MLGCLPDAQVRCALCHHRGFVHDSPIQLAEFIPKSDDNDNDDDDDDDGDKKKKFNDDDDNNDSAARRSISQYESNTLCADVDNTELGVTCTFDHSC
jgi:hypothetical protein